MKFVRPKDWVVANLLRDWATLNLAGGPVENAKIQYKLAIRYGLEPSQVVKQRLSRIDQIIARSKNKASSGYKCEICEPLPSD
ncbi:MAG: hypothetical protein EOP20_11145 [Hyphomicrobiales bacterium]|nr:MAG: hypothetical protein EOP20_11145 [Hyphomicrobiales bacterium]